MNEFIGTALKHVPHSLPSNAQSKEGLNNIENKKIVMIF